MKIKNVPWEKRNLGVVGCEFYIESVDSPETVFTTVDENDAEYQVLHVDSGNTPVLIEAQKRNFEFVEMNIQLEGDLTKITLPIFYKRFEQHISCSVAGEKEIDEVLRKIEMGDMFTTDKIARDPFFGPKISGRRYSLWTKDVIKTGAEVLLIWYKENLVGFDVLIDKGGGLCDAFLGGIFPEYQNKGLGFAPIHLICKYAKSIGYTKMVTGVSSNNIPILKLHELFGFKINDMTYTLIRHKNLEE